MRGKISISAHRSGVRVIITNFEGKSKDEMKAYAQKVIDRNKLSQYRVIAVNPKFRDDTVMIAVAMIP